MRTGPRTQPMVYPQDEVRTMLKISLLILSLLFMGCGGGPPESTVEGPAPDGGADVLEASPDAETDAETDADAETETGKDAFSDVPDVDSAADVGEDSSPDVKSDAAPDTVFLCTPDATRCEGLDIETCNDDGTAWEVTETCPYLCDKGTCTGECLPGSAQCNGVDVETCNTEGQWVQMVTCPYACSSGACTGECVPGDKKCDGQVPQSCDVSGQWTEGAECPNGCSEGECNSPCVSATSKCQGDDTYICIQGVWEFGGTCPHGCLDGSCLYCEAGTFKCNSPNQLLQCAGDGMSWGYLMTCPNACLNGVCVGVCVPGTKRCVNGDSEVCNDEGQWAFDMDCPFGCADGSCTGVCVPGTKRCSNGGFEICGIDGGWGPTQACPTEPNASPTCTGEGVCGWTCNPGFDDCTSGAGCETDLSDPSTCGSCSNACDGTNGTPTCSSGTCGITCDDGWADCGSGAGCETPLGTMTNCLSCGDSCGSSSLPNASVACEPVEGCTTSCDQTWGDCDGDPSNGCEHDIWNDSENCGACGHDCYGSGCTAGVCDQDLELVAESPKNISGFDIDDTYAYWSTNGAPADIYRVFKSGGTPELLGTHANGVWPLVVVGQHIVFYASSSGLYRMPIGGGAIEKIATFSYGIPDLVTDGTNVFWVQGAGYPCYCANPTPTKVYRAHVADGTVDVVATFKYELTGYIAVKDNLLYATNFGPWLAAVNGYQDAGYSRFGKDNTGMTFNGGPTATRERLSNGTVVPVTWVKGITVNSTHVFFNGNYNILKVDPLGNTYAADHFLSGAGQGFTADDSYFYSGIQRVSVNGGTLVNYADGQVNPRNVRLDDTHVYWTADATMIMRMEK